MKFKNKLSRVFRRSMTRISPLLNTKVCYLIKFRRRLNLDEPKTFNEKILWLKFNTYYNNELVKQCADKVRVRQFVERHNLGYLLNGKIAVYDSPEDIVWDSLPECFALKLNIGCGSNLIVRSKSEVSREYAVSKAKEWFKENYWLNNAELQYKGVTPRILVEEYIGDPSTGKPPMDYKFYCMNGICQYILVCLDRGEKTGRRNHSVKYFFMDRNWNLTLFTPEALQYKDISIKKPAVLDKAVEEAEKLAKDFPFVRVDFYIEEDRIIFGELTFTPAGGMDTELSMTPPGYLKTVDEIFGDLLVIR
ncbi:MAG: hypothetical protein J6T56_02600 [Bacteroidales bacterium]|nr:hypothetical protein [Bacteroidales bacterium]MBP5613340.1 hypothetical protein [Bacteroidales bacterium]